MQLDELKANVKTWSAERGILEQSTYEKQIEKFFEERAELFTTTDAKDAFGDQMVCLINAELLLHTATVKPDFGAFFLSDVERCLYNLDLSGAILELDHQIFLNDLNPEECCQIAWDNIKHRVGLMIDGLFVKWDNLSQSQRLEVARSGQLGKPDVDLAHCKSFCSAEEWTNILRCADL